MAYATPEELAQALGEGFRVTPENTLALQNCLEAAATEIDHFLDTAAVTNPPPAILNRTNINRAVEWWKAPDTYNGGVGFDQTGVMTSPPSGFERHAAALLPLQTSWGLA